jgi:hypothetical protein
MQIDPPSSCGALICSSALRLLAETFRLPATALVDNGFTQKIHLDSLNLARFGCTNKQCI